MIVYEFPNLNRAVRVLEVQGQRLESLVPLWELFGKEFYAEEIGHFASYPFAALSPAYAAKKQEEFGSKPILRAMDDLFFSFTKQGAAGNVHQISPLSAVFGSSDFKAIFHQSGTSRMPERPPLAEPDLDRYATIAGEYVAETILKAAA